MEKWIDAGLTSDLDDDPRKSLETPAGPILLVRDGRRIHAVGAICSHARARMDDGDVSNGELECPLHGARFDLQTGKALCLPAVEPIRVFTVRREAGRIWVRIQESDPEGPIRTSFSK